MTYGPEPGYGGGPTPPAPPRPRRTLIGVILAALVIIGVILFGVFGCAPPPPVDPTGSGTTSSPAYVPPTTPVTTPPVTSPVTTPPVTTPVTTDPPVTSGVQMPTRVDAGDGGAAGTPDGGLLLGVGGVALVLVGLVAVVRQRRTG